MITSKVRLLFVTLLFLHLISIPANAVSFLTTTISDIQSFPPYIQDYQKIRRFEIGLSSENTDSVIFNAIFLNGITANSMATAGSRTPLMRIKIFTTSNQSSSNSFLYSIDAPTTPYKGEEKIPALINSSCGAKTWMPAGLNGISFEISRTCLNLPDKFYASLFVDVDINQANQDYINIPELNALLIDYTKYPKPQKKPDPEPKKDQIISGFTAQPSYTLDVSNISYSTSTNSGLPIQISGASPSVCTVTSSTTITLSGVGLCTVNLFAPGNDLWNPSPQVSFSFSVLPKKPLPKIDQKLYFNRPGTLYENSGEYKLDIYSESGLPVLVSSTTPSVCSFPYSSPNNTIVKIYSVGTCTFTVSQSGNERYNSREGWAEIQIEAIPRPSPTFPNKKAPPTPVPAKSKRPAAQKGIEISNSQASTDGGKSSGTAAKSGTGVNKTGSTSITCVDLKTKKSTTYDNRKICPTGTAKK